MITEVPVSGESVSRNGTVTAFIGAQVGLVSMAVHGMRFPLVPQQASGGREPGILARVHLAAVRLQVRVHKFAR